MILKPFDGQFLRWLRTGILYLGGIFFGITSNSAIAQVILNDAEFVGQLSLSGPLPENLLSTKSVVLHSYNLSEAELQLMQEYLQRTGVDAVTYYPIDMVIAGKDILRAFSDQFVKREVANILFLEKGDDGFRLSITKFNAKESIVEKGQPAWSTNHKLLEETMKVLFRLTSSGMKKQNLLINSTVEVGSPVDAITGNRNEFFAVDMKVDMVGVPKFGEEALDKELEQIMTENFPFKFKLTDVGVHEKDLRKQGIFYVLCFVHTRAKLAKEVLGYPMEKSESAIVSVTYQEQQAQLKTIPSNKPVYKVYFKHIDSGNIFLGTKWDADVTWQSALLNNIRGMKAELRLN